jgi:hypothetical protein
VLAFAGVLEKFERVDNSACIVSCIFVSLHLT